MRQTFVISIVLAFAFVSTARVHAQVDPELVGESPSDSGYAWGEGARPAEPEDPLRIMAFLGAGFGFRFIRNIDPEFQQEFLAPGYLDLGAAVFLPGAEIRHGFGLALSTNISPDVANATYASPVLGQWLVTPSYHFLVPLRRVLSDMDHDWVQLQGRVGVPIVFSTNRRGELSTVTVGGEVAAAAHFKFLAGLGAYVEVGLAVFGGTNSTFHPVVGVDAGLLFDYEVLP